MQNIRKINNDLIYTGCSDRRLALFESAYPVPDGVSYNSYLLNDEKTILFDTVDKSCREQFFENLDSALGGRNLDYLIVQHMEPDHCALTEEIVKKFPNVKIVCTAKTVGMIKQFFNFDIETRAIQVKEGDTLSTGKHNLTFVTAPMVHWPEVMVTYDTTDKVLFSADAFGSFGAINGNIFDDEVDWKRDYLDEARRYYTNIVGKYGMQVQMLLKKASNLDIKMICPLHGLILKENIGTVVEKYNLWSSYEPENKGVMIAYSSVYGGTENAVNILASKLSQKGVKNIRIYDTSYTHYSKIISEAFRVSHIVFASTTYNAGIFESMEALLHRYQALNIMNRKIAILQNGSWAPNCGNLMKEILEKVKGTEFIDDSVLIKSTLKESKDLEVLAESIVMSLNG